ncbi:MAG: hypothetical protein ACRDRI_27375 [Pseudonocardiaceae bacterium]
MSGDPATGAPAVEGRPVSITPLRGVSSTGAGRHHATWDELRARHDLVEVPAEAPVAEATPGGTP